MESPDDAQLAETDAALDGLATRRADLASRMLATLEGAAFAGRRVDRAEAAGMQHDAQALLTAAVQALAPGR